MIFIKVMTSGSFLRVVIMCTVYFANHYEEIW